jgi:putative drug exporter of the RND superfamily
MFAGLADLIVKRHRMIIIAWIAVMLVSLPLAPLAEEVVHYEETEMAPPDLQSSLAKEYIAAHFQGYSEQPTTIIVITSQDVMDNETKEAMRGIDESITTASMFGDIERVEVTTMYSVTRAYTLNVIKALNQAFITANQTAILIFGMPQDYRATWVMANETAVTLYSIPEDHVAVWNDIEGANPSLTPSEMDDLAYQAHRSYLEASYTAMGLSQQTFAENWYKAFSKAWNDTIGLASDPEQRAAEAHAEAFSPFLSSLPVTDAVKAFYGRTNEFFADKTPEFTNISDFACGEVIAQLQPNLVYMTSEQVSAVRGYLNVTHDWWSSLGREPSPQAFEDGVMATSLEYGRTVGDQELSRTFLEIRGAIGSFDGYEDLAYRTAAISNLIASAPALASVAPRSWVVAEAGLMGDFDLFKADALCEMMISNSSIDDYPLTIPSAMLSQLVSQDGTVALIALTYGPGEGAAEPGQAEVAKVRGLVSAQVHGTAVNAYVTGTDALSADMEDSTINDLQIIEPVAILLVLVLIGLYFRSLVASSIPPMAIGVAVGISYAMVYLVGAYVMSVHYAVLTLLLTSMIGAGCDYCIFVLARYREERRKGLGKEDSVKQAVTWAGESIAISGVTVIIGFGVLAIGGFSLVRSMGVIITLGITIALLVALTLLPSIIILLGDRIFWPSRLGSDWALSTTNGYFTRSARFAVKNAKPILVAAVLITIPTTYVALSVDTSYDFFGAMADTESKHGLAVIQDGFGNGVINPTIVVVETTAPIMVNGTFNPTVLEMAENLSQDIMGLDNVRQVEGPTRPSGTPVEYTNASLMAEYAPLTSAMVSDDGRAFLLKVTFIDGQFSTSSFATVEEIRSVAWSSEDDNLEDTILVGGATASMYDISALNQNDFVKMTVLAIVGIYVVLMLALGSIISPLRSILTILISISWTLAVTSVLFQDLWEQSLLYLVPMVLMLVCLGLGMDYDILLTTRVREEVIRGSGTQDAIVKGVERTGGIITACGIIMAAAFGSMMLSDGFLLKQFGFALMLAILLDATVVRIYLVPAIMSLLGRWNWWAPSPLRELRERRDRRRAEAIKSEERNSLDDALNAP